MRQLKSFIFMLCLLWPFPLLATSDVLGLTAGIPVAPNDTEQYRFEILSTLGYTDQTGRTVIDMIEGYNINLALSVDTFDERPVNGLAPNFTLTGNSQLIPPGQNTPFTSTDETGILRFGVIAGDQGMDELTVSFGANSDTIHLNIISVKVNDFPSAPTLLDGLNWKQLMQTQLQWVDEQPQVTFPEIIKNRAGEIVKVSGFMMPMDSSLMQQHFLLTSSPPHCFFDIPGGPAGVIEVFSEQGIESSWEPIIVKGLFELVTSPETGIIYKLQQAEIVRD